MKINLKGKIKLSGNVKVRRGSKPKNLNVRSAVRQEMNRSMTRLRAGIRRDLRRELYSGRFSQMISDAVNDPEGLRNTALQYLNRPVEVMTSAGPVAGTLTRVGTNYTVVQESPSTLLVIPFSSTLNIRPQ